MGSIFHIPIITVNLAVILPILKKQGFTIYTAVLKNGNPLSQIDSVRKRALILGNESHGISTNILDMTDIKITIPGHGKAESLNVAVASGIILNQLAGNHEPD